MRAGHSVLIIGLAAGRGLSLKELAIPGCDTELIPVVMGRDFRDRMVWGGRTEVIGRGRSLRASHSHHDGEKSASDGERTSGTSRVIRSSERVHDPPSVNCRNRRRLSQTFNVIYLHGKLAIFMRFVLARRGDIRRLSIREPSGWLAPRRCWQPPAAGKLPVRPFGPFLYKTAQPEWWTYKVR